MKTNIPIRMANFLITILVSAVASSLLPPTAAMICGTLILTIGLTVDDRITRGPFPNGDVLRKRITANLTWCAVAAFIMTMLLGMPGTQ